MRFILILVLLIVSAGALFATAPNKAEVEQQIEDRLMQRIDDLDAAQAEDDVSRLLVTTCKLGRSGCARLIRSLMDIRFEDRWLYSKTVVQLGRENPVSCYGLLGRIICPGL
jgi:hypothetical protein